MKHTESCRMLRGAWETYSEYIHKLRTEPIRAVGCGGGSPLQDLSIAGYFMRQMMRVIGEQRW